MKLTVLTDNNILQSQNFLAEHGLSFYIESEGKKILFDCGYSDVFLKNAFKMGINLLDLDYIIFSHGHYDHTWGLAHYLPFYVSAIKQGKEVKRPTILTHPETFSEKFEEKTGEIGFLISIEKLKKVFDVELTDKPFKITEKLTFLGEIPRENDFEAKVPLAKVLKNGKYKDDYIIEDSALVYKTDEGLSIITGCSHSGICNIIEYAKKVYNKNEISKVIGGFHLIKPSEEKMNKTINYLKAQNIKELYPCHCTDFTAKVQLAKNLNTKPAGIGLNLSF